MVHRYVRRRHAALTESYFAPCCVAVTMPETDDAEGAADGTAGRDCLQWLQAAATQDRKVSAALHAGGTVHGPSWPPTSEA